LSHNVSAAPGELGAALQFGENVGHEASMLSIAISEWMDEDESMMKANRSLVGRERGVLDPVARVSAQTIQAVLRNPLYSGWVRLRGADAPEPVRGLHVPLVSQEAFDHVQAILDGRKPSAAPKRKFNPAFPLKCLVRCEACGTALTGAFCKGRSKLYPRYWCPNGKCLAVKLSRERLEGEFCALLSSLHPDAETMSQFPKIAATVWTKKQGDTEKETTRLIARLEEQRRLKHELLKAMLSGRISDAEYSEANAEFGAEIAVTEQELQALSSKRGTLDAFVRFAELQLVDLANVWRIASPDQRQKVQNLLFEGGLHYSSEAGILNRSNASLFSTLEAMIDEKVLLVSPMGFEPMLSP
jgi:site-specific DNA recombinase